MGDLTNLEVLLDLSGNQVDRMIPSVTEDGHLTYLAELGLSYLHRGDTGGVGHLTWWSFRDFHLNQ